MTKGDNPRLCGGTFFVLVLQALKQRVKARQHYKGERDGLSDPEVLIGLSYINRSDAFNDGLHFVDESIDCDQYRSVFYSIFEVMNQGQHFKHMMEELE